MNITVITATGDRLEAFALCQRYVARQSRKPDEWIVVDDGTSPAHFSIPWPPSTQFLRRPPSSGMTLGDQIRAAMPFVTGDLVVFMEDDDWYSQDYLYVMGRVAEEVPATVIGVDADIYYNLRNRTMRHFGPGRQHASLCQTAIRWPAGRERLERAVEADVIDVSLWRGLSPGDGHRFRVEPPLVVGIKGMPGRPGHGIGHRSRGPVRDHDLGELERLIGREDIDLYRPFLGKR